MIYLLGLALLALAAYALGRRDGYALGHRRGRRAGLDEMFAIARQLLDDKRNAAAGDE